MKSIKELEKTDILIFDRGFDAGEDTEKNRILKLIDEISHLKCGYSNDYECDICNGIAICQDTLKSKIKGKE